MFISEINDEFHLPFAVKLRKENRAILDMDNVIEKLAELKIEPIGLVGDCAFRSIFESSLYSNLHKVYDPFHVFGALILNKTQFPSFGEISTNLKRLKGMLIW